MTNIPGASKRVRMPAHERREQLVGVARSVFAERGFEAAAMEEIADRAGVSKPVVYEHFGGKEALYAVVVDGEIRRLLGAILAVLEPERHPRVLVERGVEAFLGYIEDEAEGFRILVRDAPVGTASGTLPSVLGHVTERAEFILVREFEGRGFDPTSAPLYARALVGMVAMVGEWWLEAGEPDRRTVADHLVNLAWNGLRGLESEPGAGGTA